MSKRIIIININTDLGNKLYWFLKELMNTYPDVIKDTINEKTKTKDMVNEIAIALAKVGIEFEDLFCGSAEAGINNWQYLHCKVRFKPGSEEQ